MFVDDLSMVDTAPLKLRDVALHAVSTCHRPASPRFPTAYAFRWKDLKSLIGTKSNNRIPWGSIELTDGNSDSCAINLIYNKFNNKRKMIESAFFSVLSLVSRLPIDHKFIAVEIWRITLVRPITTSSVNRQNEWTCTKCALLRKKTSPYSSSVSRGHDRPYGKPYSVIFPRERAPLRQRRLFEFPWNHAR